MEGRSICASCTKKCDSSKKTELAMQGFVTNIYLRRGPKITYACSQYSASKSAVPVFNQVTSQPAVRSTVSNKQMFSLPDLRVV